MNVRRLNLGSDLGLTLAEYLKMGIEAMMKGRCTICGGVVVKAGVCCADGSDAARQRMNTPNVEDKTSHRLAFFGLCNECLHDPQWKSKVQVAILESVKQHGDNRSNSAPRPLADGQTFSL